MDKREGEGHTHQLPFQKGFLKLALNISASLTGQILVTWLHLAAREAGKHCLHFRWPNAGLETKVVFLRRKESMDIGIQQFLPQYETFAPELAQYTERSHPNSLRRETVPSLGKCL